MVWFHFLLRWLIWIEAVWLRTLIVKELIPCVRVFPWHTSHESVRRLDESIHVTKFYVKSVMPRWEITLCIKAIANCLAKRFSHHSFYRNHCQECRKDWIISLGWMSCFNTHNSKRTAHHMCKMQLLSIVQIFLLVACLCKPNGLFNAITSIINGWLAGWFAVYHDYHSTAYRM